MVGAEWIARWRAVALLVALVLVAYAPSATAGFLAYDDAWLIEHNDYLTAPLSRALPAMLFDLSQPTRMELGAEYLPVRDLFVWSEVHVFGRNASVLHCISIALYLVALLFLREAALRTWGRRGWVELAVIAFALHPVHVESVGWLAGQKDLLALSFIAAALCLHAGRSRYACVGMPSLVLLAMLSKSMSVSVLAFMAAHDFLTARRPDWIRYLVCSVVVAAAMAIHMHVGEVVHMYGPPAGGTHLSALMTMSVVMLRYVATSLVPWALSVRYDVPDRVQWDLPSACGVSLVAGLFVLAAWLFWRRDQRMAGWAFMWFFGALVPVSQLWLQLENRMADRYLLLAVWAPCVLLAWTFWALYQRSRFLGGLSIAWCAALLVITLQRSVLFGDDILLFSDALSKTTRDTHAPFVLGVAFEQRGQDALAMSAYHEASARIPLTMKIQPGDRNMLIHAEESLARLLAKHGRIDEANKVLDRLRARAAYQ